MKKKLIKTFWSVIGPNLSFSAFLWHINLPPTLTLLRTSYIIMSTSTTRHCDACGLPPRLSTDGSTLVPLRRCSRCHKTFYHDVICQREHFAQHKKQCRRRQADDATDDSNKTNSPLFRIEERSNKGRSLVASQVIANGSTSFCSRRLLSPARSSRLE